MISEVTFEAAAVPEPAGMATALLGALAGSVLLRQRRTL
jgi:hypothetical protein